MQLDRPACPSMAAYVHPWRLVSVHGWLMPIHGSLSPSGLPFLLARLLPCSWAGWLLEHTRRLGHLRIGSRIEYLSTLQDVALTHLHTYVHDFTST
eukprot:559229-Pelagomonas_calceolata.AAC.3